MHQRKKEDEAKKNTEDIGRTQRNKEHLQYQDGKKRILIPKIKNKKGETINTREGIANAFAEFYENLHDGEEGEEDKNEQEAKSRTEDKKKNA